MESNVKTMDYYPVFPAVLSVKKARKYAIPGLFGIAYFLCLRKPPAVPVEATRKTLQYQASGSAADPDKTNSWEFPERRLPMHL